ncbi:MAG TPA: AAA family ATPase [Mycobacteriales bacterium]|nr:AAA family ATPase [Mycobacteriales bacterium]
MGQLISSAGSEAAIKAKATTLLHLAETSGRTGRGLLLDSIDHLGRRAGTTSGEDGKSHKYDFAYGIVAEALRQLFGDDAAHKTLTQRREGVAVKLGTGSSGQTGKRNTSRLLALLASAIVEVASSPRKRLPPSRGKVESGKDREYARLRDAGRWQRTWSADAEANASLAREALLLLDSIIYPHTPPRTPLTSALDSRVLLGPAPLEVGGIEIEVVAEAEGRLAFEEAPRLRELEELAPRARTGLVLRLVPSSVCPPPSGDMGFLEFVRRYGVLVAPQELDQLVTGAIALEDLVALKLFRGLAEGRPARDFAVDTQNVNVPEASYSVLRPAAKVLEELPFSDSPIRHPHLDEAAARLRADQHVLITGASSSGKSTLILQLAEELLEEPSARDVLYVNFGETPMATAAVARDILFRYSAATVILVDDLQSYPGGADLILGVASLRQASRLDQGAGLTVGAATWREFGSHASGMLTGVFTISISPRQLSATMARRFSGGGITPEDGRAIAERYGNDLHLLRLALQLARTEGPDFLGEAPEGRLAQAFLSDVSNNVDIAEDELERTLLVLAALGQFDISAPRRFLAQAARIDQHILDALVRANYGRVQGVFMRLGHRSLCAILATELSNGGAWNRLAQHGPYKTTEALVTGYLESLPGVDAIGALRAICARATFRDTSALDEASQQVVHVWTCFNSLIDRIMRQQTADPTWGHTPSSAMYACQALAAVGRLDMASSSRAFLRDVWRVGPAGLHIDLSHLSTRDDFVKIGSLMETLSDEEVDQFHATWVAGLCLTAEASVGDADRLGKLVEAVWDWCLPSGGFFPESVPWVTARILMAMGAAGETVHTSEAARKSADWLLKPVKDGGACENGIWPGGTHGWNSDLEATSMVLAGLAAVGVDQDDRRLHPGVAYVRERRNEWTASGKELDGALAMRALLAFHVEWTEVADAAAELASRAIDEALWQTATASANDTLAQSCRTAQIAADLLEIAWAGVRANIAPLLGAISLGAEA